MNTFAVGVLRPLMFAFILMLSQADYLMIYDTGA